MLQQLECVDHIIVCDNSTYENDNESSSHVLSKVIYLPMGGNRGISRAYNRALEVVTSDYICLMDDDTPFDITFFQNALSYIQNNNANVYLPVVILESHPDIVVSPTPWTGYRTHTASAPCLDSAHLTAINSGMIISRDIFENYQYDEGLFLEFVDHKFILDMRNCSARFAVMTNVTLAQKLSTASYAPSATRFRFFTLMRDSKVFYSWSTRAKAFRYLVLCQRLLKDSIAMLRYQISHGVNITLINPIKICFRQAGNR